jgi:hypothetical protein
VDEGAKFLKLFFCGEQIINAWEPLIISTSPFILTAGMEESVILLFLGITGGGVWSVASSTSKYGYTSRGRYLKDQSGSSGEWKKSCPSLVEPLTSAT